MWAEGLAVHAAAVLNPGATDAELLLTMPEPIRPRVEAARHDAICAVIRRLDSEREEDHAALFMASTRLNARLSNAQVRPLLEGALRRLAPCP